MRRRQAYDRAEMRNISTETGIELRKGRCGNRKQAPLRYTMFQKLFLSTDARSAKCNVQIGIFSRILSQREIAEETGILRTVKTRLELGVKASRSRFSDGLARFLALMPDLHQRLIHHSFQP